MLDNLVLAQMATAVPWEQWGLGGLVAGTALAIAAKVIDRVLRLAETVISGKKPPDSSGLRELFEGAPCKMDPAYIPNVSRMAAKIESWDERIQRGDFSCAWKGRDEIRDLLQAITAGSTSQKELTREVRTLIEEIRITRRDRP